MPFMRIHEVENPLLEVLKNADLHCMEKVGLREGADEAGNMSKDVESVVDMQQRQFGISCLSVGIAERSIWVEIQPGVLLVRRDIISKFVL